ncbi:MAG: hypothetical protein HYT75_00310, partial [Deltaproteobacteria bacterium]|nr:hypothetical protein [Deltaproteobacteria bacterium]
FLKRLGFDAVKECDEFKPQSGKETPSALCNLRMRVGDILGSPLVTNGYYAQKQPIMIKIRGDRALPPRISFFNQNGRQYVDVQIGELDLSFFALEADSSSKPIITFKLSALLALEISGIETDEEDPSRLALKIRPDANLTRITFRPVEESNTTVLDGSSLSSALEEKINYGIAIYSDKAIKLKLPKEIEIGKSEPDEFSPLGLEKISFGKDGLQLKVEENQEYIDILIRLILTQFLSVNGEHSEFTVP